MHRIALALLLLLAALQPLTAAGPAPAPEPAADAPAADVPISPLAPIRPQWWDDTRMDRDGNHLHDALDLALAEGRFIFDGRVSVLVDFDHMPMAEDEALLAGAVGFEPTWRFHHIPIIAGWVAVERLPELLTVEGVVFVTNNGEVRLTLDSAATEHHVDQVWDLGFDGSGITVAIIDTGIDPDHLSLNDFDDDPFTDDPKVVAFYDALDESQDKPDDGTAEAYDDNGHGSHCAGISAGTGEGSEEQYGALYRGMAPGAGLVGVKVLDGGGGGSFEEVMRGMEWTIDHQQEFNIRAASMSLGGVWVIELTQEQEERLTHLANEMVAHGIALAIAAGNSGAYGTIGTPGAARDVITVGATEHDRELAIYSSKGPTHEGQIKPNMAAIGSSVWSVQNNDQMVGEATYTSMSGTSMATPMVAGIVALLNQANPDLQPLMIRSILESTSEYRWLSHPVRPNNDYGWGFVEADTALAEAVQIDTTLNLTIDPATPTRVYENEDGNQTLLRYVVHQDRALSFEGYGNVTALEWRDVNISDTWHRVAVDGEWKILVLPGALAVGNVSLWVRAVSDVGYSAPLYLPLAVEPPLPAEDEDTPAPGLPLLVAALGLAARRRRRR